jgi:alpha-galactosidase
MKHNLAVACILLIAGISLLLSTGRGAETVWLSSLEISNVTTGWGHAQADKSIMGKPLSIAGKQFEHGLGTHADSVARLNLNGTVERFSALVGVDDDAGSSRASISFKVVGDGKTLWKTGVMRLGESARPVELEVRGIQTLFLVVDSAGDGMTYDHADWAEAKLIVDGGRPAIVQTPREAAVVLTPKPAAIPRINGARIFGVRPGHPFLFTVPATGDRPMSFSADNLPTGLYIDPPTGQISGRLEKAAEFNVRLQASNHLGSASSSLKIVCGDTLALTPHMGWNSWYVCENHVTDQIMRAAAEAMVNSGLINHGYQYVNIDDCWAVKPGVSDATLGGDARDAQGRVNPNGRFPDMKALTDYIHSKGLKAGIYTSPGPLTCAGHVGAYRHEAQDAARFAEWGFDFLKYDWCSYGRIAKDQSPAELQKPYRLIGDLLRQQDRDIVLNLCQYGMGKVWEWGKEVWGHSWRTAGDLGGSFEGIPAALFRDGFDVYARNHLENFGGPGAWNDPDYLLLGYLSNWKGETVPTPLSPNEQYTHVSLWCLLAAPLILSGDITRLDEFTLSLLTTDEVLAVDQDPLGKPGRRIAAEDDQEVWAKPMEDGSQAVGLFNRGEMEVTVTAKWSELGLNGPQIVRDLWRQQDLGSFQTEFQAKVPRHGVVLVRIRKG